MTMRMLITVAALLSTAAPAAIPTPVRPVTDPRSISSPVDPLAAPVPISDLVFSRGALDAAWSADGRQLFVSTNLTGRYNIWRMDAAGSWPVQLTQADDNQSGFAVAPDGRTLYFTQDKGGNEQYDIYAVPTAGGATRNLTNTPEVREEGMLLSPDGRSMALSTKRSGQGQVDLAVMDLSSGQVRALTHEADPQWGWSAVEWIDGGRSLIANRSFVGGDAGEVWRVDAASGQAVKLLGKPGIIYTASGATADGSAIAVTTNEVTHQQHAAVFVPATRALRTLRPTPWEQSSGAVSPDGRSFVVQTSEDGRQSLSLVDLQSLAEQPLTMPPGVNGTIGSKPFTHDGRQLLVLHSGADTPSELQAFDLASEELRPLTHFAMASLAPEHLPKSRIVTFRSYDGTLVSAVVTMPFNLSRDGHNPAVVMPHGGPTGQTNDGFSRYATALASRGYVVIQPNPRGSTGYGLAFQKANFQDLGGGDLKDELAAKRFLVDSGYVDPRRVGIAGGSYGGFMTLMAIGKAPDEFAAAVDLFGIIDWRTMWQHEDALLQAYQKTLLGTPEQFPKVYDATSPLTYIKAVKAPLLVQQGENDIRVPAGQARQVVETLKARGNVVEAVYYPDEGHGFYKREHQQDSLQRMVDWFDKYLKAPPKP
ncbi:S9 family peptidase [Sphingomonas sp. KRR8]|uniref:S9 family peptidase n=1 Tax=Sphingomonas sp. KRR8 TaxID=2942996 RepID=UPI00202217FE|nr:S9 family peptidase [Sphingomonas sp. KRR8]URD60752.1 S9 family peptidase [Sphingomonas sp. KRR8]